MPTELYNAGRVTGLSAYEIYVKQHDAVDPDSDPATEREWLASMMGSGSAMILKIPAATSHGDNENWLYDVQFPTNSKLVAASTIVASHFRGDGRYSGSSNWADGVSSYGDLISNTSSSSPSGTVGPTGTIPYFTLDDWTADEKEELVNYMKIIDGVIIQPGRWSDSGKKPPQKDLSPDLGQHPKLRLHIRGPITKPFEILLVGFMINTVVMGQTGVDTSTNTESPEDGDFLGPAAFPWASKINFYVPTSYISYFMIQKYKRKLPTSASSITVDDTAVIDMRTTKPETYYEGAQSTTKLQDYFQISDGTKLQVGVTVDDFSTLGDGSSVLTVYQKKDVYPPALWGTYVDAKGTEHLNPLDCVAPGSVKMFNINDDNTAKDVMKDYENTFPGTNSMNKNDDGELTVLDKDGNPTAVVDVSLSDITYGHRSGSLTAQAVTTSVGKTKKVKHLALGTNLTNDQYSITVDDTSRTATKGNTTYKLGKSNKITPTMDNIVWSDLLDALANDMAVDLLGNYLKMLKAGLSDDTYPYIQFANGLRLYISATQPTDTDVPDGSIGIGWGLEDD